MDTLTWIHVAAGAAGLLTGYVALYAAKGKWLHRRIGMLFVFAMITMGLTGAVVAALTGVGVSVIMGTFTAYLVFTALTAVRPVLSKAKWIEAGLAAVAVVLGLVLFRIGAVALDSPGGVYQGLPAPAAFVFGAIALAAGASDVRAMRGGGKQGAARITRHLWRMCFALFIAAMSFFFGQTDELPVALRAPALLAVPVLAPLVVMSYWLGRLRLRRAFRKFVGSHVLPRPPGRHTKVPGGL